MSTIEKIIEIPVTFFVPILKCGHAGEVASLKDTLRIGDEQECLACKEGEVICPTKP